MSTKTNALGNADGVIRAASNRLRYLGAPRIAPVFAAEGETSVFSMADQVQGGIPPRREPL